MLRNFKAWMFYVSLMVKKFILHYKKNEELFITLWESSRSNNEQKMGMHTKSNSITLLEEALIDVRK